MKQKAIVFSYSLTQRKLKKLGRQKRSRSITSEQSDQHSLLSRPFIVFAPSLSTNFLPNLKISQDPLQALGVVVVLLGASVRAHTGGGASPANSATLGIVGSTGGARATGGSSGGGAGLSSGGGAGLASGRSGASLAGRSGRAGRARSRGAASEGGVERTSFDVRVDHVGVGVGGLDGGRVTRGDITSATRDTGGGGRGIGGVGAVQPEHVGSVVIPETHDQDHAVGETGAHAGHTTVLAEVVGVTEGGLLRVAEGVGDRVTGNTADGGVGLADDLAVLHIEALDLGQSTRGGTVVGDELSHHGEGRASVNGQARTVEGFITHTVRVKITSIGIASTAIAISAIGSTAGISIAHGLRRSVAGVRSDGIGDRVSLPDVHLRAARAVVANAGVNIVGGWGPAFDVALTVDELEITRALAVTVTSSILGTGLVGGVLGHATIGIHVHKVEGTVETTGQVRHIHIEGELLVQQVELLVGSVVLQQIQTRTDVLLRSSSDKVQAQRVAAGGNTVCAGVASTVQSTVGCAGHIVGAEGGIPSVAGIAVGRATGRVNPAPVGIDDNTASHGSAAATGSTLGPGQRWVSLSRQSTSLLGLD